MKNIALLFLALNFCLFGYSQATSSSNFQLKILFDADISVKNITPRYYKKSGNSFDTIHYSINKKENAMIIKGHNDYVLWVDFPVLEFSETRKVQLMKNGKKSEKIAQSKLFYFISKGISSYTGKQIKTFKFSETEDAQVIIVSQEKHNKENSHENLKINIINTYDGDAVQLPITTKRIKINKL
ncbi:hypothetical protein [Winogradskyella forsetii]|uniref:hypothetical protein n=1 Tax=Winogradskyella forsetii TaxID=2686077 RepID=UPI0015BB2645|nr:hypothetical protein [Winogradskyella forsetii]